MFHDNKAQTEPRQASSSWRAVLHQVGIRFEQAQITRKTQNVRARPHVTRICYGMACCRAYFQALPCITGLCKTNARAIAICPQICSGIGPRIDRKCSGITHCCTIIGQTIGYIRLDTVAIPECLSIDSVGFTERFILVLLWLLETLGYSMGNRKYASEYAMKYAMKYAMPRYIQ